MKDNLCQCPCDVCKRGDGSHCEDEMLGCQRKSTKVETPAEVSNAIVIAHWPGNDTPACEVHWKKLLGLASVMGFPLTGTTIPPGTKCENCENEAKLKKYGDDTDPETILPSIP